MAQNKEQLEKLLKFIDEISNQKGNEWFKSELIRNTLKSDDGIKNPIIEEIYEYCIQIILKNHAENFYSDFKLGDIKQQLETDFIRIKQFRRCDDFEDFCMALFQQLEAIVNRLIDDDLKAFIGINKDLETHKIYENGNQKNQKLWQLIFNPKLSSADLERKLIKSISDWDFIERYKAVLFRYYFKKKVNYISFQRIFFLGNDLYQARNLNHRGGKISPYQQATQEKLQTQKHKYFLKFLGFLEDFTSGINGNID
jgi:hypothetical protein